MIVVILRVPAPRSFVLFTLPEPSPSKRNQIEEVCSTRHGENGEKIQIEERKLKERKSPLKLRGNGECSWLRCVDSLNKCALY
jgi:hypothetical protein